MIEMERPLLLGSDDRIPESFKIEKMSSADFAYTLNSFLFENFRGAIDITTEGFPFGSVEIATDGAAYLIRLLLKEVYGKYVVGASIILGQGDIKIKVKHRERSLDFDYITKIAEKSGFSVIEDNSSTLILSAKVHPERRPVLYAVSAASWRRALMRYVINE